MVKGFKLANDLNNNNLTTVVPWLLKCPFCGHAAVINDGMSYQDALESQQIEDHIVGCGNDACQIQPFASGDNLNEIIALWNKRA